MKSSHVFLILMMFSCTKPASDNRADNENLIKRYYGAYEDKDWHSLELILADHFTFTSPAGDDHIDVKTYKERCWPNAGNTKKFDLQMIMIEGDSAFVTYNGWTNDGKLFRNTEYFKFKDGKIVSDECYFGPGKSFPNNK